MKPIDLEEVVDAWILAQESNDDIALNEVNPWPIETVMDWRIEGKHDLIWRFILTIYKRNLSTKVQAMLAAGPLEDFLTDFGEVYIEQVEKLAQEDQNFNRLLGGVWQNAMTDNVWQRVQAVRKELW